MVKQTRLVRQLTIANEGSKKVPIVIMETGRTRSGRKFRHEAEDVIEFVKPTELTKSWTFDPQTGWFRRTYA